MENIRLTTRSGSSSVIFVRNDFEELFSLLSQEREVVVIIDKNVDQIYGQLFKFKKIVIEVSEEKKSLDTINSLVDNLLKKEVSRDALLLGVGGGITTDIVGFTACIYKRGVRFAFVATSLLAQVDASIGGKNGVNHSGYKNIIGSIRQPDFTYINISVLKTLPKRELYAGIAEMLKIFVIADQNNYSIGINYFKNQKEDIKTLNKLISSAIKLKCWIVERDELEHRERRLLNLGHTFGHAIEKCCMGKVNILHGEAISIGMVIAAKLSYNLGYLSLDNLNTLMNDLQSIELPIKTDISMDKLFDAIKNDKKRESDSFNLVLIQNIGQAFIKTMTLSELEEVIYDLY